MFYGSIDGLGAARVNSRMATLVATLLPQSLLEQTQEVSMPGKEPALGTGSSIVRKSRIPQNSMTGIDGGATHNKMNGPR